MNRKLRFAIVFFGAFAVTAPAFAAANWPDTVTNYVASVRKTGRVVVVDEDNPRCSMATDLVALIAAQAFDNLDAPPQLVTAPHTPVPFAPPMEQFYIPSAERIAGAVRATL